MQQAKQVVREVQLRHVTIWEAKQMVRNTQQRAEPWLTGHGRETCLSSDEFPPLLTKEVPTGGSVQNSSASAGRHRGGDSGCCAEVKRLTALVAEMAKNMSVMKVQLEQLARNTQRREVKPKSTLTREQMAKNPPPRETLRESTVNRETPGESTENREALSENTQNRDASIERTPKNSSTSRTTAVVGEADGDEPTGSDRMERAVLQFGYEEAKARFMRWSKSPFAMRKWEKEGRSIPSYDDFR